MTSTPPLTLDQLAEELANANEQIKAWEERRLSLLSLLEDLYDAGQAPEKFTHNGISYSHQVGRTTFDYSQAPFVAIAKQALEQAQEEAKALGLAKMKQGRPTWRLTA